MTRTPVPKMTVELVTAIREALEGDSNDAEHDALVAVAQHFGIEYISEDDRETWKTEVADDLTRLGLREWYRKQVG